MSLLATPSPPWDGARVRAARLIFYHVVDVLSSCYSYNFSTVGIYLHVDLIFLKATGLHATLPCSFLLGTFSHGCGHALVTGTPLALPLATVPENLCYVMLLPPDCHQPAKCNWRLRATQYGGRAASYT